jgi:predicted glutamine amidotransferase
MDKSVFVDPLSVENKYNMTSSNHLFPAPQHNGAVPNIRDKAGNAYASVAYKLTPQSDGIFGDSIRRDMVGHLHKSTILNEIFFSADNIAKIQQDIREQVLLMSSNKYHIDNQDEQQLKIIMRSYYLMYSENNDQKVSEELASLNKRVVGYAAAKVFSEVDFYEFYVKDIEEFAAPIANPMNVGVRGTTYR